VIDRSIRFNLTKALAAACGLPGLFLIVANFWMSNDKLGFLGLAFIATGAVLRIRSYVCALSARERNAYELGRDMERDSVRSLRR
jgi:hypothetical protein